MHYWPGLRNNSNSSYFRVYVSILFTILSVVLTNLAANEKEISANPSYGDGVSTTLHYYQKTVESLLDQDSCQGVSVEELELFKNQFRTSAYTCRLRSCPRATIGFDSDQLRREHEMIHAGGFRCKFLGCQYPPFRSSKTLAAHVTSNHSHPINPPRRFIRRTSHIYFSDNSTSGSISKEIYSSPTESSSCGKSSSPSRDQTETHPTIQSDIAHSSQKRSRSPELSPLGSPKIIGQGSTCLEFSPRKIRLSGIELICYACRRRPHACIC